MMRLPLSDAAREETLTMILTLGMRARGGLCPCRQTLRRWPIVCQCAGVRTVGGKKAKVLFLTRAGVPGWDGLGGRPLFKVKLILNFRINERKMACHEKL